MNKLPGDLLKAMETAPYPVYATDENHRIIAWNGAAAERIGHGAEDALGRECHALMTGTDVYGNRFCTRECNVMRMVRRDLPVNRFDLELKCASGERVRVHCTILVVPGQAPSRFAIIHLLEEAEAAAPKGRRLGKSAQPERPTRSPAASGSPAPLTPRELQVLRMLAASAGTGEIAASLYISPATVRTHVRNILDKMGAHSRLEAVLTALRKRLI